GRRPGAGLQRARRRMAGDDRGGRTAQPHPDRRRAHPGTDRGLRPAFSVRPLKHARLDYMMQKAVEMGAARLAPVITRHTQVARVNLDRMRANAIEAAEQCGILTLPEIATPVAFDRLIAERDPTRLLVFCDEESEV